MKRWIIPELALCMYFAVGCVSNSTSASVQATATALMNSPQPPPSVVARVKPAPGSVVSLSSPADWKDFSTGEVELCVQINVAPLLEPGDSYKQISDRKLLFDGQQAPDPDHGMILQGLVMLTDEHGRSIAYGPDGQIDCWQGLLSSGVHVADFRVWTTSGVKYEYSWTFKVVP